MSDFLNEQKWIAIDIETTGVNPWKYEIIEIGAVIFSTKNGIENQFSILIKTIHKQDPKSKAIHNITDEETELQGVSEKEAIEKFINFLPKEAAMVFHNAPFDISFLKTTMLRNEIELPTNYYYDNLYLSRLYFPDRESHSLQNLKEELSIDVNASHRALPDAYATAKIFLHTLNQHANELTSSVKLQKFMKFQRRFHKFEIKIPKNFDKVELFFKKYIQTGLLLKIKYKTQDGTFQKKNVQIKDIMVFNQNIYLKSFCLLEQKEFLIPLENSTLYDVDKGQINYKNL